MAVETNLNTETQTLEVSISGRFDFSIHQNFRKITQQTGASVKVIAIDLSETDYMDSSALGMLLVLRDKVNENKEAIIIKNSTEEVRKILKIANFDKLFTLDPPIS
ncbi:MAG: STAS domain-containing protein [Methylococcales bacterium]|nr:STAS domain-containing protein [Methylococcales bacterium]